MGAVAANVVGLGRFLYLLTTLLIPRRYKSPSDTKGMKETKEELDKKYDYLMGLRSLEVIGGIETKFCPQCHAPVAQFRRTKQGVQIIRDGKVMLTFGNNVTISIGGKEQRGFTISCPNGHTVRIE